MTREEREVLRLWNAAIDAAIVQLEAGFAAPEVAIKIVAQAKHKPVDASRPMAQLLLKGLRGINE